MDCPSAGGLGRSLPGMADRAVFVEKGARFGLQWMLRRVLSKGNSQNLIREDAMRFRWCAAALLCAASLSVAASLKVPNVPHVYPSGDSSSWALVIGDSVSVLPFDSIPYRS